MFKQQQNSKKHITLKTNHLNYSLTVHIIIIETGKKRNLSICKYCLTQIRLGYYDLGTKFLMLQFNTHPLPSKKDFILVNSKVILFLFYVSLNLSGK